MLFSTHSAALEPRFWLPSAWAGAPLHSKLSPVSSMWRSVGGKHLRARTPSTSKVVCASMRSPPTRSNPLPPPTPRRPERELTMSRQTFGAVTRTDSEAEDEGTVGYGRPPRHTRFKRGQSGNPKGRPKGSKNIRSEVCQILTDPILVKVGGKQCRM